MSAVQFFLPHLTATVAGIAQPGAQFAFYQSGTLTPLPVYTDAALTRPQTNPVRCNGAGALPTTYLDNTKTYRLIISDKNGAQLDGGDIDPFIPGTIPDASALSPYSDAAAASASAASASATNASTSASSASTDAASARAYLLSLTALPTNGLGVTAASRTAMSMLPTTAPAILGEGVRRGVYHFLSAADYATITGRTLTADVITDGGNLIVPKSTDSTGASGAWVYPYWSQDVSGRLFGVTDGTDIKTALEKWATVVYALPCISASCTVTGTSALPITLGNSSGSQTKRITLVATINATATMDVLLTIVKPSTIDLNLSLWGSSSSTAGQAWTSRQAGYGLRITAALNSRITGKIVPTNFKFWGVLVDDSIGINGNNSNYAILPYIRGTNCGISHSAGGTSSMSANWNTPVRLSTSGNIAQTTTIIVDASPGVDAVEGTQGWIFWIAGYPYSVKTMVDNGNGTFTLTLYAPWLDNTSFAAGSGTGFYTVGGVCAVKGTDDNIVPVEAVFGLNCGYVFWDGTAYGATARRLSTDGGCDVLYAFGRFNNGFHYGGGFDELYIEGTDELAQVFSVGPTGSDRVVIGKITGAGANFAKWFKLAPRAVTGDGNNNLLYYQEMSELAHVSGYAAKRILAQNGPTVNVSYDPPSLAAGATTTTDVYIPAQITVGTKVQGEFFGSHAYETNGYIVVNDVTNSTARISLTNRSLITLDDPSGTLRVTLTK